MLMKHYLGENFTIEYLEKVANINSDEYYVKMAVAWYFATALTKRYKETVAYMKERKLDVWIHNKAIQKACECYTIPNELKDELRKYKIK